MIKNMFSLRWEIFEMGYYLELSSSTGSSAAKAIELNDITTIMKKSKYRKFTTQWAARRIL